MEDWINLLAAIAGALLFTYLMLGAAKYSAEDDIYEPFGRGKWRKVER